MKDSHDIIARLLAAEDHPHLREEFEVREARDAVERSPELQREFEEAKAFFERHPVLVDVDRMPGDVRERIAEVLRERTNPGTPRNEKVLGPWEVRVQFAWAAILVLLLAGMAVISSTIIEQQETKERRTALNHLPPADAFRSRVGELVGQRLDLRHRSREAVRLVHWLEERGVEGIRPPDALMETPTIGCTTVEGPRGPIAVVCFDLDGNVVHLFTTPADRLGLESPNPPRTYTLHGRTAMQWNDETTAYLLIPNDTDVELPEIFL